jgi:L-cysteine S-thiosulfotransferase
MWKLHICTVLAMASVTAAMPFASHRASGAECKRKTAGFYLQEMPTGSHILSPSAQNLPPSLTGAPGDAGRGREVLVSHQKGDCLSCHKVSALSSIVDQGSIGPALDGVGGKYNEGQLRQVLIEPKSYFPGTIMPSYYRAPGSPEASVLTAFEIEDLVAYMKTLK